MSKTVVTLYKAKWCGHCNDFMPEWQQLEKIASENGIQTVLYDVDENKTEVEEAQVGGFPTIKIDGEEYNGKRSVDAILTAVKKLKGGSGRPMLRGGGDEFYEKYRKYKTKYLRLKEQL